MADKITDAIHKIKEKVKNGKYRHKKVKIKTTASKGLSKEAARKVNDNITNIERKEICKTARNDINPAKGAHNPVADMKREVSNEVRKDLGLD